MQNKEKKMKLRFIQRFCDACKFVTNAGTCYEEGCDSRAVASYNDEENNAYYWCEKHRLEHGAPDPIPGVEYAPTMAPMMGWCRSYDGKRVEEIQ